MTGSPLARLRVRVPAGDAELAVARGCMLLGAGCREYPEADGTVTLEFWVPAGQGDAAAAALRELGPVDGPHAQDEGWRDAMRGFHQPVMVDGRLLVRPPWGDPVPGVPEVVIDPGMAFGTGQHDTTRGCLALMLDLPRGGLVDVGCGSGILAIAACRLGFGPVWAFDNDPLAVEATVANARVNGVALTTACRDLTRQPLPRAEVMVANLTCEVLCLLAQALADPPGLAVLSGLRPFEVDRTLAAFAGHGYRLRDRDDGAGWCSLLVAR
ncbi:MAG: 50S ribosomal protein L11 methyltransferase [Thermoleophilia bacterium]